MKMVGDSGSVVLPHRAQKREPTGIVVLQTLHRSSLMSLTPLLYYTLQEETVHAYQLNVFHVDA
jgi:hypothetical protein